MSIKLVIQKCAFFYCLMFANQAFSQTLDFYDETGINSFQTQDAVVSNESVDPFSGLVQLSNDDIVIPGNAGLDIVINRSYTSRRRTTFESNDVDGLGTGWSFHFGKLVGGQRVVNTDPVDPNAPPLPSLSPAEQIEHVSNIFNIFTSDG